VSSLAYTRSGAGAPLVLLHGLGGIRQAWDPVIPILAERFDVLAVDLPGFGDSEPLPAHVEPTPAALAASVASFLDGLGVTSPHIVGHSHGGWVALEFAHLRPAAALTLLSPAGLWRGTTPLYQRVSLRVTRWFAEHATGLLSHVLNYRLGRVLVLGQLFARPWRMTADEARAGIRGMGGCPGFHATYRASISRCYQAGQRPPLSVPTTVAFGSRDFLLVRRSRRVDELPPGTRVGALPGCGHVPMSDDPDAVATLIAESARPDSAVA
jgi:pimeloyl-ACP methyl ester carboxylesterase